MDSRFDLKIIPEFDGTGAVVEWIDRVQLVCDLSGVKRLENIIPLRLTGGAFAVYQQLTKEEKSDAARIKGALLTAFADDKFTAYEKFETRFLRPGETVDVYLADLRRLSVLFGGIPDHVLVCVFVRGLPNPVKRLLQSSSRVDDMTLEELLARARALMKDNAEVGEAVVAATRPARITQPLVGVGRSDYRCYKCNGPNHFARDCMQRRQTTHQRCYRCNKTGHLVRDCPGNEVGDETSAPV